MADLLPVEANMAPAPQKQQQQQQPQRAPAALTIRLDPDVASLSLTTDKHMQALTKDAVDHLLGVKAGMMSCMEAAVAHEREDGDKRLQAKQVEMDAATAELRHTQQVLDRTDTVLDRVAGGYAGKQQAVYDRLNLLRSWYVWREWAQKKRRLQYLGLRVQQWYVRRWLLGRAWDRWQGQARLQYRTLVAERAEKQQKADAAALHAVHAQEAAALRAQIDALQQQLQEEAAARKKMEEEMKRSFMRGVTAINLEALQIMRRGAPPSGANPFPVPIPLTASSAAAGLAAASGAPQSAMVQDGAASEQPDTSAAAAAADSMGSTFKDWASTQQQQQQPQQLLQQQAAAGQTGSCATGDAGAAAATRGYGWCGGQEWAPAQGASVQAQSMYGAAAVVQLQPGQGAGLSPSSLQQPFTAPRVFVERGPVKASPPAGSPAKGVGVGSPQGRVAGVRRSLQQGGNGRAASRR